MVSGIDLIRRAGLSDVGQPFALTSPLIVSRSGKKFGKTEDGAVWLDADRTSPYAFYQFWLQTSDEDVADYLRYFTLLDRPTIEEHVAEHQLAAHKRHGQRVLAEEITRFVHGEAGLQQAQRATEVLFTGKVAGIPAAELKEIFADVPSATVSRAELNAQGVRALLVGEGLPFASNSDAKRALKQGSVTVNGQKLAANPNAEFDALIDDELAVVRLGKKRYHLVRVR